MTRSLAGWTSMVALMALVIGCSGVVYSTNTPAPSPTWTFEPVDPSGHPTAALPDPTPPPWEEIEIELLMLELRSVGLPIEDDSPDFDLLRAFGGWAEIGQPHFAPGGLSAPGGLFDCADPLVWCGNNPVPIGGNSLVLIGLQGNDTFDVITQRDGQLAVCFDRLGATSSPDGSGAFGGCDLVIVADLTSGNMFELVFNNGQFQSRNTVGRAHINGDTALFAMPLGMDEEPGYRVVTFERIPPQIAGGEHTDLLPFGDSGADSFFDIYYEIPGLSDGQAFPLGAP